MKIITPLLLLMASSLFANTSFESNTAYSCVNTHSVQQGQRINSNLTESAKQPFVFTIKENKLISSENVVFDFKMKKGPMSSYSNANYMLLLTPNMQVGLVPKKAQGAVQFYFQCAKK